MEIEGRIIMELPKQEGTSKAGNPWKKREWVLETLNTQYPRKVKFHVFGDRSDTIGIEVGKDYALSFDVESREFNGRWYTDVSVYQARELSQNSQPAGNYNAGAYNTGAPVMNSGMGSVSAPDFSTGDSSEDLPF